MNNRELQTEIYSWSYRRARTVKELAWKIGVSERKVSRAIESLIERGFMRKMKNRKKNPNGIRCAAYGSVKVHKQPGLF